MSYHYHYTTINSKSTGRASYFFRSKDTAEKRCDNQNSRAESFGIKARYTVVENSGENIETREIRD